MERHALFRRLIMAQSVQKKKSVKMGASYYVVSVVDSVLIVFSLLGFVLNFTAEFGSKYDIMKERALYCFALAVIIHVLLNIWKTGKEIVRSLEDISAA